MANQRPINRRPWRKKPWAKKRPTRWNASSNGINGDGEALATAVPFYLEGGTPPIAIIADGQLDVEPWADEQEVTIDRIVGSIMISGRSGTESAGFFPPHLILKMGIVLNEELTDGIPAAVVTKDLFNQESLEDTEWMWLDSRVCTPFTDTLDTAGLRTWHYAMTEYIDLRNRRKIGQKDELALYAQFGLAQTYSIPFDVQLQSYTDVRCILMSR